MNKKITGYLLIFLGVYLLTLLLFPAKKTEQTITQTTPVMFQTVRTEYPIGDTVKATINNTSTGAIIFTPQACPQAPLAVLKNDKPLQVTTTYHCNSDPITIDPGSTYHITFDKWNTQLFATEGEYKLQANITVKGVQQQLETSVKIRQSSWIGNLWDLLLYRPIYNTLILCTTFLPGHDLGWSIIFLTLLIRIILLIPNQRMMEQQKRMQKLQPKIAEIQKRYEGDQQKIGEETLKLWKEHKVNPLGSCLPVLIQMPVLIALYYAIGNGLDVGSTYFLYEPLKQVNIESINAMFLNILDLSKPNVYVLPIIIGVLQFIQMKLALNLAKKKKEHLQGKQEKKEEKTKTDPSAAMGKSMTYIFPVLIALMTAGFPAGVGLYWGVSTIFAILQQMWVNREKSEG
jgi:YidC/Oxa1 family membrane protein insertase